MIYKKICCSLCGETADEIKIVYTDEGFTLFICEDCQEED
jgi:hypothetical protein